MKDRIMISRIKGMQDFLDLSLYNGIVTLVKKHLATYNFKEIATPILEPLGLFQRSLGLETDVVTKEMYTISTHNTSEAIALRPEATASVVRAFVNNNIETTPWKVFNIGPMFRHERPQKGRYRQFHQITMEIIGSVSIHQDAYFIKMLDRLFYEKLNLQEYALGINFLGCPEDRVAYRKELDKFLSTLATLCTTCTVRKEKNIIRVFDCKQEECQAHYKKAPFIADYLCVPCATEWQILKDDLKHLAVSYSYMPMLVRGLDYYSKTVFEFVSMSQLGSQNAFCGGGRYDHLAKEVGAKEDQPSIGAAIGIERLLMMLEPQAERFKENESPLQVVIPLTPAQQQIGLLFADYLEGQGFCVDILLEGDSVKSMMRKANKMGAANVLILGPDEQEARTVSIKNMLTGEAVTVPQIEAAEKLKS